MWEPKTSVNWVTLSPNYGSINTITTETDTGQGDRQYREYDRGRQFGPGLRVGYGSWDIAPDPGTHYHCTRSTQARRFRSHRLRLLCHIAICFGDSSSATAGGTVLAASGPSDKFPLGHRRRLR